MAKVVSESSRCLSTTPCGTCARGWLKFDGVVKVIKQLTRRTEGKIYSLYYEDSSSSGKIPWKSLWRFRFCMWSGKFAVISRNKLLAWKQQPSSEAALSDNRGDKAFSGRANWSYQCCAVYFVCSEVSNPVTITHNMETTCAFHAYYGHCIV